MDGRNEEDSTASLLGCAHSIELLQIAVISQRSNLTGKERDSRVLITSAVEDILPKMHDL